MKNKNLFLCLTLMTIAIVGCTDDDPTTPITPPTTIQGNLYVMTNAENNEIISFDRAEDGKLNKIPVKTPTQGAGNGKTGQFEGPANNVDPLASNYALRLSNDNKFLFAVNFKSNELSSFTTDVVTGIEFVQKINSGGIDPKSLAVVGNTVFVAHRDKKITAFTFDAEGRLTANGAGIEVAAQPLAIKATKDNEHLVVTMFSNKIATYSITGAILDLNDSKDLPVQEDGADPAVPFGIETLALNGDQYVYFSEARGGATESSTVSCYKIGITGELEFVNRVLLDDDADPTSGGQIAACWIGANSDGSRIYTSNTVSSSIACLSVDATNGKLTVENLTAYKEDASPTQSGLIDFVIVKDKIYQQYSITGVVKVLLPNGNNLVEIDSESFSPAGGNQGIAGY